ncbi:MAG: sigma 54-interacting transcriptional regulator [Spirochaetales bacterium]|nr:sigma 54-interacting transcriptional regulator [Spirochaetales bacterium]
MPDSIPSKHYRRKIQELSLLFDISQILQKSENMQTALSPIIKHTVQTMEMLQGAITLLNRHSREISIEASYGISEVFAEKIKYKVGEGITGKVIETGEPITIENVSGNPLFLDKTESRKKWKNQSFICIPVKIGTETIGTISCQRQTSEGFSIEEDAKLLSIIGSMIALAAELRRTYQEEQEKLKHENERLQNALKNKFKPKNIIGSSTAMQEVFDLIAQVSGSEATVLIRGESGTGKELIANAIHYNSRRADMPLIKVNCAALPETIIESELFGHEKGAFTGALSTRKGRFELADGGTIFLDEIGDLSPTTQVKLLRILQEKEFERVGGNETIKSSVRIIAATNRDLEKLLTEGKFREDLYYRLNVFPVHVPPLRSRKSDIMLLADYFTEKYSKKNNKDIKRISTPAIQLLTSYHWPGNVRELENCIERAVLISTDDVIHGNHLPPSLQSAESTGTEIHNTLQQAIDELEKEMILDALKSSHGNMTKAAKMLGISERIMGLRKSKFGINPKTLTREK